MMKTKSSETIKEFGNRPGGLIYRQMPDGTTVVSRTPDQSKFKREPKEHQQRMQGAARYARWAAKATKKTAFHLARSDWFHAPIIHEVRLRENLIRVQSSDNVMITKVVITVLDEQGRLLEAGEATRCESDWWEYILKAIGKTLTVEAWDLPGNVTRF